MKVKVKICGLRRVQDALLAVELGAAAVGFIFYPKSPRYLSPEDARRLSSLLPPFVQRVGVFVNESPAKIRKIKDFVGLDLIQLHGDESPTLCELFYPRVIKAFRVKEKKDLLSIKRYRGKVGGILLDTFVPGMPGGTGKTFDWYLAREAQKFGLPLILAGGLTPQNAREAVLSVSPYGIDVNSGVEIAPGVKHPALLKELFRNLSPFL